MQRLRRLLTESFSEQICLHTGQNTSDQDGLACTSQAWRSDSVETSAAGSLHCWRRIAWTLNWMLAIASLSLECVRKVIV